MNTPLLIAHRGDTVNFIENTIESFKSAFSLGANGIELDVQLRGDNLIVVHNYRFDPLFAYPSLESVLEAVRGEGRVEIEVKCFSSQIIPPLKALLNKQRALDFELTTSVLPMVHHLAEAFPEANIGAIFDDCQFQDWMDEDFIVRKISGCMALMGANVAHISSLPIKKLTKNLVKSLQADGIKVHSHIQRMAIQDQVLLYRKLMDLGINQCTIDDINLIGKLAK